MPTLLQVDSSPMGSDCITRRLTREFVQHWKQKYPQGQVIYRDVANTVIPVIQPLWVAANYTPEEARTVEQQKVLELSDLFVNELQLAGEYVLGVPMHNWGPAASFKLWTDQLVRFGKTVLSTPSGTRGALRSKQVTFVIAAGRRYDAASEDIKKDHLRPWLKSFFGNLGIERMHFHFADGTVAVHAGKISKEAFLSQQKESLLAGLEWEVSA